MIRAIRETPKALRAATEHFWVSNTAFERMTGIRKICVNCRLALDKGERLSKAEWYCPGKLEDSPSLLQEAMDGLNARAETAR